MGAFNNLPGGCEINVFYLRHWNLKSLRNNSVVIKI